MRKGDWRAPYQTQPTGNKQWEFYDLTEDA